MKIPDWLLKNYKIVLVVFVLAIMIYLAYVLWDSKGTSKIEGFTQAELTDLLDKIRVNIYNKDSDWNNQFYNNQPLRRETPLSFWTPLISDNSSIPRGLKLIGTCVSDKANYDAPNDSSMLISGDVKAPTGATEVFKFPHNQLTLPRLDSSGQVAEKYVLKDVKNFEQIDERIGVLEAYLLDLKAKQDSIRTLFIDLEKEIATYNKYDIVAYGPDSYFKTVIYTTKISNGQQIVLPENEYFSLRVPIGSSGTLVYEDGFTDTFSFSYSKIIDPNNPTKFKYQDTKSVLTYDDINEPNSDIDKFMITGLYGLNFLTNNTNRIFYEDSGEINSRPYDFGTSLNHGFGDTLEDQEYDGLYAFGKSDLVEYFNKIKTNSPDRIFKPPRSIGNKSRSSIYLGQYDAEEYENYWFVVPTTDFKIKTFGNKYRHKPRTSENIYEVESPHITEVYNTEIGALNVNDVNNGLTEVNNLKREFSDKNTWYTPATPGEAVVNDKKAFFIKQVYVDLAFRMHTKKKSLRGGGIDCPDGIGCNCCDIDNDKWVGLWAGGKDHGKLVSATINFTAPSSQVPFLRRFYNIYANITVYIDNEIKFANKQLAQLYQFQTLVNNSMLTPFPLRIIRPTPPDGYVALGDILFNHNDPNYTAKLPLIDKFGCVPKQCVRDMRDWLASDKIYEFNRDGKYLGIYKNPYLQTFRATTVPNIFPPGKVNKVVACVESCKLVDDIIGADKCARKFYNSNKAVIETTNLDNDSVVMSRESAIYKDRIREKQDTINELEDVARKLKVQDDKAELVNREFNRQKLQNVIGSQRVNIAHLTDRMKEERGQIDVNLAFDYSKFLELIYKLEVVPDDVKQKIIKVVDESAGRKLEQLPDDAVNAILAQCPTPETEGLVRKSLVESGCYGCANLQ